MFLDIEAIKPSSSPERLHQVLDKKAIRADLLQKLDLLPYQNLSFEHDRDLLDLARYFEDEIDLDLSAPLISKKDLKAALIQAEEKPAIKQPSFLNPAHEVCNLFNLAASIQDKKKKEHFSSLQSINQDLDLISKVLGAFQTCKDDQKVDFSQNEEMKALISEVKSKWGFPESDKPFVWENKNQVTAFLTQKTKEMTHRSSESMLHLQHQADLMKTMADITKNMLDEDAKLKATIINKTNQG